MQIVSYETTGMKCQSMFTGKNLKKKKNETITMKWQILFSRKQIFHYVVCWKFYP